MTYKVKLLYFKNFGGRHGKGGKYYSEGEYQTEEQDLGKIWDEVERKRAAGDLPGLVPGAKEFHVLIDVPNHPINHPHLIVI